MPVEAEETGGEASGQEEQEEVPLCEECEPEDAEDGAEEESERQRPFRDPGMPAREEIEENEEPVFARQA